jgi:hypothetical protein
VYPLCYFDPHQLPETFLDNIAQQSPHPLFISETGWTSNSFPLTASYTFSSTPEQQATYIAQLQRAAAFAIHQHPISAIDYVAITDASPATCDAIKAIDEQLNWYCSLALEDYHGTRSQHTRPCRPGRQHCPEVTPQKGCTDNATRR